MPCISEPVHLMSAGYKLHPVTDMANASTISNIHTFRFIYFYPFLYDCFYKYSVSHLRLFFRMGFNSQTGVSSSNASCMVIAVRVNCFAPSSPYSVSRPFFV